KRQVMFMDDEPFADRGSPFHYTTPPRRQTRSQPRRLGLKPRAGACRTVYNFSPVLTELRIDGPPARSHQERSRKPMSHEDTNGTARRTFLQAGAIATAATLGAASGVEAQVANAHMPVLPKRKLGKTGLEMTLLEMGSGALRERGVLDRLI